jgi:predicted RNA-binding Zn-ribbon protein involved in translation (DUF1610 family)
MASLHCPHCGASLPSQRSWAEVAISTLISAPAVPDMATQMRCTSCGRMSASSSLRHAVADRFRAAQLLLAFASVVFLAWALWRFVID